MNKKYQGGSKTKSFLKRNVYYIIMVACILAIATMITVAVITQNNSGNNPVNPGEQNPNQPNEPNEPNEPNDPTITEPVVFELPVASGNIVRGHEIASFVHWVTLNQFSVHRGIDFSGEEGEDVMAVYDGTVTAVKNDALNGWQVWIDHGDGLTSYYASLSEPTVNIGDKIKKGDNIAKISDSGAIELELGMHLHFEVFKDGKSVDPFSYFLIGDK
ncbi:MAG: M23 family metallopeptidase [Firmicutes bacterium]|nr:M23 family metallopeptidase [Bacillota bacterium]